MEAKVLTSAEVAEIKTLHGQRYNFCGDILPHVIYMCANKIPALCDSHDAQSAHIAELEREKSELLREQSTRAEWCSTHLGRLRDQVADLTAQLAEERRHREQDLAHLGRATKMIRACRAQLADRDKAIASAPCERSCASLRLVYPPEPQFKGLLCKSMYGCNKCERCLWRGTAKRFYPHCNCWKSRALAALTPAVPAATSTDPS